MHCLNQAIVVEPCATARHMQTCICFGLCPLFPFSLFFPLSALVLFFSTQHKSFPFFFSFTFIYFIVSAYHLHMLSVNRLMENTFLLTTGALSLVSRNPNATYLRHVSCPRNKRKTSFDSLQRFILHI